MASLTDAGKKRSPLANMALATNAWKKQHERPISQRLVSTQLKQKMELKTLGFEENVCEEDHINFGLPSSLSSSVTNENPSHLENLSTIFPQVSNSHLEMHLSIANEELEKTPAPCSDSEILCQMFPQYHREGITCVLQSCNNNLYEAVDLLLKLLPQEIKKRDPPEVISFSQTAVSAVSNIPDAPVNPFAKKKATFCKRCGHQLPDNFMGTNICPNPACCYPFQPKLRM